MRHELSTIARVLKSSILPLMLYVAFPTLVFAQTHPTETDPPANSITGEQSSGETGSSKTDDAKLASIIQQMNTAGVLHPNNLDEIRRAYVFNTKFESPAEHIFRWEDRNIPTPSGNIRVRVYIPNKDSVLPVFVFFHGGGFVSGNLDTHDAPLRAVANRCNCIVVSVAYRLAPENPFPAAPDDCYTATKWVADHAAEIGGDPHRIAIGGDGAGGNLAAVVALMAGDRGGPHLSYEVLLYPVLNADMSTYSWIEATDPVLTGQAMRVKWTAYVPLTAGYVNPYISPAQADSLKKLPPTLIIAVKDDPVWDEDQGFARDLEAAGVPVEFYRYPNTVHGFFLMSGELYAGMHSIDQVASALRRSFQSPK